MTTRNTTPRNHTEVQRNFMSTETQSAPNFVLNQIREELEAAASGNWIP